MKPRFYPAEGSLLTSLTNTTIFDHTFTFMQHKIWDTDWTDVVIRYILDQMQFTKIYCLAAQCFNMTLAQ